MQPGAVLTRVNHRDPARPSLPPSYVRLAIWGLGGLLTVIWGVRLIGTPALLVLAGVWLLAAAFHFLYEPMAGPAAWAAGVVLEVTLLVGSSGALALVSRHSHPASVYLIVLAIPVALGAIGVTIGVLRSRRRALPRTPARPLLPALAQLTVFGVLQWIGTSGGRGAAWAMSGDARNHVLITRHILADGGLTTSELRSYPALVNSITALLSGAGGRTGLAPGALMLHDARALAATYAISAVGVAALLMAALLEAAPRASAMVRRLPIGAAIVVLTCASLTGSSMIIGISLVGGFVSAIGSLPVSIAAVILGLRFHNRPSPICLALLSFTIVLTFISWTPLAAVPFGLTLIAIVTALVRRDVLPLRQPAWLIAGALAVGLMVVVAAVSVVERHVLERTFQNQGAIEPLPIELLYLLGLLVAALIAVTRRRDLLGALVAIAASILTVWWIAQLPGNSLHIYYAAKMVYLTICTFIWVPFVPVLLAVLDERPRLTRASWAPDFVYSVGVPLALSVVVLGLVAFASPIPNQLTRAHDGWAQPADRVVATTTRIGNEGQPFIYWKWSNSADDRLGDFWATMTWATTPSGGALPANAALPEGPLVWAYFEADQLTDLCKLGEGVPHLTVISSDATLSNDIATTCPQAGLQVRVVPAPN